MKKTYFQTSARGLFWLEKHFYLRFVKYMTYKTHIKKKKKNMSTPPCCPIGGQGVDTDHRLLKTLKVKKKVVCIDILNNFYISF